MSRNATQLRNSANPGLPANGVSAAHVLAGNVITTTLKFNSTSVTVANTTGASFGNLKVYDFPAGRFILLGGTSNLTFNWAGQDIAATGSGDYSFGTTGTSDATLNSTDVDFQASTAMLDPFVAGVGTGSGAMVTPTAFDGTSTAKDLYLNIIIDDADVADGASDTVLVTGTATLVWAFLGDY